MSKDFLEIKMPSTLLRRRFKIQDNITSVLNGLRNHCRQGLHLGCGDKYIEGMINCDLYSPVADVVANCTDLSQFQDGSVDLIETNHTIEHLSFEEADKALQEWNRILAVCGVLVITCPDLDEICRQWSKTRHEERGYIRKMIYGSQEHAGMFHKSGYDRKSMTDILNKNGFSLEFIYSPYPNRPTPSLLSISRKLK